MKDDKLVVTDTYDHLISLLFSPTLHALSLHNKPQARTLANSNEDITHAENLLNHDHHDVKIVLLFDGSFLDRFKVLHAISIIHRLPHFPELHE